MIMSKKENSEYTGEAVNAELRHYYESKLPLIKRSLTDLFPKKCTNNWVKALTGREERPWDTDTLQVTFLDPINQSIQQRKTFHYALGSVLLLESSSINPEKYLPLIGISEVFAGCLQLFKDISIHDNPGQLPLQELNIDNSIKANAGVALLTLPYYPILHNYCNLDQEVRLWLFQNTTQSISRVFYANGTSQYRKNKSLNFLSSKEYAQESFYLNGSKLKFTFDLWLSLTRQYRSEEIVKSCEHATRAFTLSYQLAKDLNAFNRWLAKNKQHQTAPLNLTNNFILLHIAEFSGVKDPIKLSQAELIILYEESGAEQFIRNCIQENGVTIDNHIDELSFSIENTNKIKAYIRFLYEDSN